MLARFRDRAARVKERGMPPGRGSRAREVPRAGRARLPGLRDRRRRDLDVRGRHPHAARRPLRLRYAVVDFLTRADLTGRIRGLVIMLDDKITIEQSRAVGRARSMRTSSVRPLEQLAGVLAEAGTSLADDLRTDFDRLSTQVGNQDRVMELLGACPPAGVASRRVSRRSRSGRVAAGTRGRPRPRRSSRTGSRRSVRTA